MGSTTSHDIVPVPHDDIVPPQWLCSPDAVNFSKDHVLGRGTFGFCYNGTLKDAPVCVKLNNALEDAELYGIQPGSREETAVLDKVRSEALCLIEFADDSNIVPFKALLIGVTGKPRGLIFDVALHSLQQLIDEDSAAARLEAVSVARGIFGALSSLHARGLVHRDVRPPNILHFGSNWKLGGFSQCEAVADCLDIVGNPSFCAPEMKKGEAYGTRVDVYSGGVTMCRLLLDEAAVLTAHTWDDPHLQMFADGCLASNPEDRFTADQALDVFLGSGAGQAPSVPSPGPDPEAERSRDIIELDKRVNERFDVMVCSHNFVSGWSALMKLSWQWTRITFSARGPKVYAIMACYVVILCVSSSCLRS